ncbi:hypothetical protein [Chelativorans sp. AA-79]|uniref:hypothetical protein n=1 Tax=Chelativorans sp. AA-79 TaxID=3028735 RepID=UPI0023F94C0A|nr:hypothetical protein [Chelativorans sp. AA-79]WEX10261.1 hypothetical protein PVE73_04690 [Chelativorans sp. AA-79]
MPEKDDRQLRLLCMGVHQKTWDMATEEEREHCRSIARDMERINEALWPTHPAAKTQH